MSAAQDVPRRRDCACKRARHRHGTRGAYSRDHCRCLPCAIAYSRAHATGDWTADPDAWVDRTGTIRRLQALAALGWPAAEVARRLNVTGAAVSDIMLARPDRPMLSSTAARIAAVYDQISMTVPYGRPSTITTTRRRAAANGWAPPLAWDDDTIDDPTARPLRVPVSVADVDEVKVERAVAGHRVDLTRAESRAASSILEQRGMSAKEIGDVLDLASRTVVRRRAVTRQAAGAAA